MITRGHRKELKGVVISDRMQKTIIVETRNRVSHPLYKKEYLRRNKFVAHDEKNSAKVGDWVRIGESRPLSRTKRWKLIEVVRTATIREEKVKREKPKKDEKKVRP